MSMFHRLNCKLGKAVGTMSIKCVYFEKTHVYILSQVTIEVLIASVICLSPDIFKTTWDNTKALVKSDGFAHTM